ncbi:MAG: hypothetical protein LBQ23_03920 [Puniceicoccales bacterium]|jgi:hypothetical protein|nr:hypothetical protein [Puniceicoccales bacterium]
MGPAATAATTAEAFLPRLPNNHLQILLSQGQWGNAFIGLVQDIWTSIPIIIDSINSIFAWADVVVGNQVCKDSYVQAIEDLLQLPSGIINLFRDIIIAHHCLPSLPKVRFTSRRHESYATNYKYGHSCEINLRWSESKGKHAGSNCVLIARNSNLPMVAGTPGSQLDFVTVKVPPSVVLSHELGHYVHDLIACKDVIDGDCKFGGGYCFQI